MIYYFSATGNSKTLALALAERLNTKVCDMVSIVDTRQTECRLMPDEVLGFVFPIYGWSLPNYVKDFISQLNVADYSNQYIFFAVTCGDDIGVADKHISKSLKDAGLKLNAGFSVLMPDCYINLPGFDVDKDEERKQKLANFSVKADEISNDIKARREVMKIKRGALPYTKTYVLGGLFRRFLVTDKPFHVTEACTNCGLCQKVCPTHNIVYSEQTPVWKGNCTGCLACYHHCPVRAIRFGNQTEHKGQYLITKHKEELR